LRGEETALWFRKWSIRKLSRLAVSAAGQSAQLGLPIENMKSNTNWQYEEKLRVRNEEREAIRKEERDHIGKELWVWWFGDDGETSAHAIRRVTGVDSPKPIPEDQWNLGKRKQ